MDTGNVIAIFAVVVPVFGAILGWVLHKLDKATTAADHYKEAYDTLRIPVERFGMMADPVGAILRATGIAVGAQIPPPTVNKTEAI